MIFWIPNFKSVESLESRNCLEFFDSSQFLDIGHKVFWYIYHSTQWKKMEYIFPDFWMIDSWPIRKLENGGIFEKYDGGKVLSAIDFCHWACAHRSPWPRSPRLGHPKSYFMTILKFCPTWWSKLHISSTFLKNPVLASLPLIIMHFLELAEMVWIQKL